MGNLGLLWLRQLSDQHALCHVVRETSFDFDRVSDVYPNSHASIDPALRAERGLPEDLIRLCVGIEDPVDLIDDLEHALLEAGAITVSAGADQHQFVRATLSRGGIAISRAVEKLAYNEHPTRKREDREWFVSAPGKVILFGEHAVVHGVVRVTVAFASTAPDFDIPSDCHRSLRWLTLLWPFLTPPRWQSFVALHRLR